MNPEWQGLTHGSKFKCQDSGVLVHLQDGRRQVVMVEAMADAYVLWSTVAKAQLARTIPDVASQAWERNRAMVLVGFRVDRRGNLIGEVRVPKAGLKADEWQFLVLHLAQECDRFEFQLTGQDVDG